MSELQISLISIGFVVVLMICIYNWWQQRQYRRKFRAAFQHGHEDALYHPSSSEFSANPVEPSITSFEEAPFTSSSEPTIKMPAEELLEESPAEELSEDKKGQVTSGISLPDEPSTTFTEDSLCASLDEKSDYMALMSFKNPVGVGGLSLLWQQRFNFGNIIHVCGLNAESGEWEKVIGESLPVYRSFKLALQLVNRSGAVSEAKLKDFRELVRTIAIKLYADVVLPDVTEAAARAQELDKFCATVDQIIAFNIMPDAKQIRSGDQLSHMAEQFNLRLQADGVFHMIDSHGHTLFTLCNEDNTPFQHHTLNQLEVKGLTFLLDVPCVEQPASAFDQMVVLARKLASELGGEIVDANHVPLKEKSILLIRERIVAVEKDMQANQMVPGSILARRLFS